MSARETLPLEHEELFPPSDPLARVTAKRTSPDAKIHGSRADSYGWPEPDPLQDALPDVAEFDLELMPESFRPWVNDVAERMPVPMDFPAVTAIATLAAVTGRRASIQPKLHDDTWIVIPNLWGALIGEPGTKKSPTIACITQPARAIESAWREAFKQEEKAYKDSQEVHEIELRVWRKECEDALKNKSEKPNRPRLSVASPTVRRLLTNDATPEKLHEILSENPAGVWLLRDELTGWLAGLERQGREMERAFFLEGWAGDGDFTIDRIGRGSVHVPHLCVSVFGGIQPARLRQYLSVDVLRDGPSNDGLMQRFQLLVWPDFPKLPQYIDRKPDRVALERASGVYGKIVEMDASSPLRLSFDSEAQKLFQVWFTDLEGRILGDELHPSMRGHLSKYPSLMPSLALLFALADGRRDSVPVAHAKLACDWCEYLETHARRVYASQARPEQQAAIALSKRLAKGWKREEGVFTVRDVYRNGWNLLDSPDLARGALLALKEYGWVREQAAGSDRSTGRPSQTYLINPKIRRKNAGE